MIVALGLFFGFFALYLHTIAPHLAPYRDAGEMASLLGILGVAHPPGYPLYTLIGRVATLVPLGTIVYRANMFSALCAAGALVFLFLTLRTWLRLGPALIATGFFGFSNPFWDLATVSEMYALGVLWFCLLLFVTFRMKNPILFSFLMALGLGVRMDMLLLVPLFLAWFWFNGTRREFPWMIFFLGVGSSVFLYLMIRSRTDPLIDWANPDNLLAVFNSARRKNYSGTLDLLSLSYQTGENFFINIKIYIEHLIKVMGWWGIGLSLLGGWKAFHSERRVGAFFTVVFVVTGPVFLFLANMPPNPHSLAIVEASYLIPDLMVAVMIGFGVEFFPPVARWWVGATVVALMVVNLFGGFVRASKRHNLYARDFVENVFRCIPRSGVAVFHKDIQLFSLWAAQLLEGRRPDVSLVATGLSASPWYWEMKKRWKTAASPEISLKDNGGWKTLQSELGSRPLVAGYDVELNDRTGMNIRPHGILMEMNSSSTTHASPFLLQLCLFRGKYIYGETPDFFSTDLIGDQARAHHQMGFDLMMHGQPAMAEWFLQRAESMDPTFPRATSDRGYAAFTQGNIEKAYALYGTASRKSDRMIELAVQYKALPEVANNCRNDASGMTTQWGVMAERLGRTDEARQLYLRAIGIQENAQAHYNLAVTYWGRDWGQVITHMRRALELNPQMAEARNFLAKAEMMSRGGAR